MHIRIVRQLLSWSLDHSRTVFVVLGVLSVLSAFAATELRVEAGHSKMVGADALHTRRFNAFIREFGSPNSLVALVQGGDEAARREVTRRLAQELPSNVRSAPGEMCRADDPPRAPGCVRSVMARIDVEPFAEYGMLYMPPEQLAVLVEQLEDDTLGAGLLVQTRGLTSLFEGLTEGIEAHMGDALPESEGDATPERAIDNVARVVDVLRQRVDSAPGPKTPPLLETLIEQADISAGQLGGMDRIGYLSSADGALKLATVRMAHETDDPRAVIPFVGYVRGHAERIAQEVTGELEDPTLEPLSVLLTGYPALIADESLGIQRDLVRTTIVAVLGVMLFFMVGFRSLRFALLGLIPLVPAVLCTLAFVRYAFDYLSILTSSFVAVMIGLGVDFAVYLLVRFQEARREGQEPREAAETAALQAGPAILTGGLTTAGAFFALSGSSYKGFAELGVMGGIGVLTPLFTTLLLLPALLAHPKMRWFQHQIVPREPRPRGRWALPEFIVKVPLLFVMLGVLASGSMAWQARDMKWSFDYASMLDPDLPSVKGWVELTERTSHSTEVAAVVAPTLDEAVTLAAALEAKESVDRVDGIISYLPEGQPEKLRILSKLAPIVGSSEEEPSATDSISKVALADALQELIDSVVDARFEAQRAEAKEAAYFDPLIKSLKGLKASVDGLSDADAHSRLAALQGDVLGLRDRALTALRKSSQGATLTATGMLNLFPEGIRTRLASGDRYALYAYPKDSLKEGPALQRFVRDMQSVSSEATGFPISHFENITGLVTSFREAGLITLLAVLFLLFLDFRAPGRTLLAMLPLSVGLSIAWGGMALLGMDYHPANVIAYPLVIGIGIDAGVHILHRYKQEGVARLTSVIRHTGRAVLMSTGTTMIGFGSLSLASHTGMSEMGQVLLVGIAASLVGATIILPATLALLGGKVSDGEVVGS
ncbi:MAG: MMPL family transporter [Myxococcota bacterium]